LSFDLKHFKAADQAELSEIIIFPKIKKYDKEFLINSLLTTTLTLFNSKFPNRVFQAYCYINGIDPSFFIYKMKGVISKAINKIK